MELQRQHDMEVLKPLIWELERFQDTRATQVRLRYMRMERKLKPIKQVLEDL
jgi:hypothetical protein